MSIYLCIILFHLKLSIYLFIYLSIYLFIYLSIYLYVCVCVCAFFIWVCLKMTYLPKISWWIIHFPVKQRDLRGIFDPIQTGPVGTRKPRHSSGLGKQYCWLGLVGGEVKPNWQGTHWFPSWPFTAWHAGNVLDVRYGGVLNGKTPIAGWFMMENPKHIQQIGLGRRHRKPWFSPFKCVFSCKCSLQFRERFHFWMIHPITVIHVNYLIFFPIS